MIKVLVLKQNGVVIDMGKNIVVDSSGIHIGNTTYPQLDEIQVVEIDDLPHGFQAGKYKYIEGEGFVLNENYKVEKPIEEQVDDLKAQIQGLQMAMAELTILLAGGEA